MSVKFSVWGNHQFVIPTTGAPASGFKLFTYVAGSSTLVTTFTTSVGDVAQSNPIILNSGGFPTIGQIWITEGTSIKIEFTDDTDVVIKTEDNISGVNDTTISQDEWVAGPTPTFIGTTTFSLIGDQTTVFHVGRKIRTINTGGTIYSRITVSAFTSVTTITVVNDSGVLDSGLSIVSYGLVSSVNTSIGLLTNLLLTTPIINSATGINQSIPRRKTADESVASSTTLQNDDVLLFPIAANREWIAEFHLTAGDAISTTGIKLSVAVPAGATLRFAFAIMGDKGESHGNTSTATATPIIAIITDFTNTGSVIIKGQVWVLNSTTAGNVTLQWAQNTSSATALKIHKGSFLSATKLS